MAPPPLATPRLLLREPVADDCAFLLALLNDPDWIRYIGDRGVRTQQEARRYLEERLSPSFRTHGFGLWLVAMRDTGARIGLCGLLRRQTHPDVELGYAFLPVARGRGLAAEAAGCALSQAEALPLSRLVAITVPENAQSAKLLRRLGFHFEDAVQFDGEDQAVHRYAISLPRP